MAESALNMVMSTQERARLDNYVAAENKRITSGRKHTAELAMNDFLKILTAQLAHQDPASPVEDKEFIGQMAQISSLKQMTSMASDISNLANVLGGSQATAALGRNVEIESAHGTVSGAVNAVTRGGEPTVLVNGQFYPWKQVTKVF